jgi:hypothetical protein
MSWVDFEGSIMNRGIRYIYGIRYMVYTTVPYTVPRPTCVSVVLTRIFCHTRPSTQGTEDEVIHISCAKRLHELAKNAVEPLWAEGFNHQNLEMCSEYLPKLRDFVTSVERRVGEQA